MKNKKSVENERERKRRKEEPMYTEGKKNKKFK